MFPRLEAQKPPGVFFEKMFKEINIPKPDLVTQAIETLSQGNLFCVELSASEISALLSRTFKEAIDSNPPIKASLLTLDTKIEQGFLAVQLSVKMDFPISADIATQIKISAAADTKRMYIKDMSIISTPHGKLSQIALAAADPEKLAKRYLGNPHESFERYLKKEAEKSGVSIQEVGVSLTDDSKFMLTIL